MGKKKKGKKKTIEFEADFDLSPKSAEPQIKEVMEEPLSVPKTDHSEFPGEYRRTCIHCGATWQEESMRILQEMCICRNCR